MMVIVSIMLYSLRCQLFHLPWKASIFQKQPLGFTVGITALLWQQFVCYLPTKRVFANRDCLTLNFAMFALLSSKNGVRL